MSVGSWGLLIFSGFAFVSFVDALVTRGRARLLHGSAIGKLWSAVGSISGFFLAGTPAVLLSATNQPVWTAEPFDRGAVSGLGRLDRRGGNAAALSAAGSRG